MAGSAEQAPSIPFDLMPLEKGYGIVAYGMLTFQGRLIHYLSVVDSLLLPEGEHVARHEDKVVVSAALPVKPSSDRYGKPIPTQSDEIRKFVAEEEGLEISQPPGPPLRLF